MRIAVLSGKGGTGKTFVSVNLLYAAQSSLYIDCDVEEPNGRIFLKPEVSHVTEVKVLLPQVDINKCSGCKTCVNFCKFNALAYVKNNLLIFPELCHACGGCTLLCPNKALTDTERVIGLIEYGDSREVKTRTGILNTGEVTGVPIIKELLADIPKDKTVLIDCPPGSSCAVMESIKDSDFCLLVTEPTLFGIHNLSLVYELVKLFKKPFGVVINKDLPKETIADEFCEENKIPILAKIPYDPRIGSLNAQGMIVAEEEKYYPIFKELLEKIKEGG